jgi:GR25 family glycosyltransferase involved in LPS biosynthesis
MSWLYQLEESEYSIGMGARRGKSRKTTIKRGGTKKNSKNQGKPIFTDAYAITMNTESERYKQTEASAKAAGINLQKWDAVKVDDTMGDSLMEQGIGSIIFKGPKMRLRGAIGCFLAHRGLMRHIAEKHGASEGTLILEDDVTIPPDFQQKLQALVAGLPNDWDILYLDKVNPKSHKVTDHLHKFEKQMTASNNWGNWAYIVKNSSLKERILPHLEHMFDPVDLQLHKFADKLNIYLAVPSLITLNKNTTYNSNINKLNMQGGARKYKGGAIDLEKPGIFITFSHDIGLGNQLFIYAAGLVLKNKMNVPLYVLPVSANSHSKVDYRFLFKDATPVDRTDAIMERVNKSTELHADKNVRNKNWSIYDTPQIIATNVRVKDPEPHGGYYQNYAAIVSVIPTIRNHIIGELKKRYGDVHVKDSSAFMHVRRGDYTKYNVTLPVEYYKDAIHKLKKDIKHLYIICESSDISWCKEQGFDAKIPIEWVDEADELKVLYIMSLCTAGAIISNSTFSSWGAILGADKNPSSTIVYPLKWWWLGDKITARGEDLSFPERWIGI